MNNTRLAYYYHNNAGDSSMIYYMSLKFLIKYKYFTPKHIIYAPCFSQHLRITHISIIMQGELSYFSLLYGIFACQRWLCKICVISINENGNSHILYSAVSLCFECYIYIWLNLFIIHTPHKNCFGKFIFFFCTI